MGAGTEEDPELEVPEEEGGVAGGVCVPCAFAVTAHNAMKRHTRTRNCFIQRNPTFPKLIRAVAWTPIRPYGLVAR
jgi:hypothetical protein